MGIMKDKRGILKRVLLVFAGLLCVVAAANAVLFMLGLSSGFFERWSEGQYFGMIAAIREDSFDLMGQDARPRTVLITAGTAIRRGRDEAARGDLRVGRYAVVVGRENSAGEIEARVVRIFNGR